jgi:cardiolipin synthase A/B
VRAFTGGFCIADEWAGDPARGRQPWRDAGVDIEGPAAAALDRAFAEAWAAAGRPLPPDELAAEAPAAGNCGVRVIAGVPGRDRMYRTMDLILSGATERFWVTDAYFMAPRRLFQSLLDAARDGVDVRLLVPGTSDLPWIRNLTRFGYRSLLHGGVRIYEWGGAMLHAKTAIVDGRWSRVGSSNLNPSSLFGNWELDVLVDDQGFGAAMEAQFRRDLDLSTEVRLRPIRPVPSLGPVRPTALAFWTLIGGARLATFVPVAAVLLVAGALFLLLPRAMAMAFGLLFLWLAGAALVYALRRSERA